MREFKNLTENFTGRKFMCMSLIENEKLIEAWSSGFRIGGIYREAKVASDGCNLAKGMESEIILLLDDNRNIIYADRSKFVEVEGMHIVLKNIVIGLN